MTPGTNTEFDHNIAARFKDFSTEFSSIDGSCYLAHLNIKGKSDATGDDCTSYHKVSGATLMFVASGHISGSINTTEIEIDGPALLSLRHGQVIQLSLEPGQNAEIYLIICAPAFLQDVNISFTSVQPEALLGQKDSYMKLSAAETEQTLRFIRLMHGVMSDKYNQQVNRHIVSNLISALFYQLMLYIYKRVDVSSAAGTPRRSNYVSDFMRLVHLYYTRERSVNFYASRLYISPKYLSLLVKEATGQSAARWIDHFVVTEAKNLLRFSGKNVQQVAYALNFSNQSSFGKYFKHLTGMSPTEYQKL